MKFDYSIPRGASIGVYGRRNALPTHTQYHFKEVLSGFSANSRTARATHVSINGILCQLAKPMVRSEGAIGSIYCLFFLLKN